MLTQEKLKSILSYYPETGEFIWLKKLSIRVVVGSNAGYVSDAGYILIGIEGTEYRAHRLAWLYMTGAWPIEQIDHRNRIRDDNRWKNLREATSGENKQNLGTRSNNTSGCTGVSWEKRTKKWAGYINVDGRRFNLGRFSDVEEARDAYLRAKAQLHVFNPETLA